MILTLLHTADAHRATFDNLAARLAPDAKLQQHVRTDWLVRAQTCVDATLESEIEQMVQAANGPVICTCSTLGPAAARVGANRIDQPMMQRAAEIGGTILMVYCLETTRIPSLSLLAEAINATSNSAEIMPLFLGEFWPLFESGQTAIFSAAIANAVRDALAQTPEVSCVVFAQVSMSGAAPLLADVAVPVLTSPEMALRAGLGLL